MDWSPKGGRSVGRPKRRWDESILEVFKNLQGDNGLDWRIYAVDKLSWQKQGDIYMTQKCR